MKKRICKMLTLVMTGSMVLGVTSPVYAEKKDDVTKISFAIWDEVQKPIFDEIIEKFETENPDIDVDL
ncbi:hypothetical protein [Blautia sp. LMAG:36]|uniref:hypothetical protein n=1 Tax=Blautia sp. LMAG:36 TaxID=1969168 RepID=UPI00258064AD|nr:hypothetical protein [Blautia sp. LMAG:36]